MGLADLGNFILQAKELNLRRPLVQAQTQEEQNQAALSGVQAKSAAREYAKQNLTLDPDAVVDAAHFAASPQMPDVQPMPAIMPPGANAQDKNSDSANSMPDASPMPAITPPDDSAKPAPAKKSDDESTDQAPFPLTYTANGKNYPQTYTPPAGDSETPGSAQSPETTAPRTSPNLASTAGSPKSDQDQSADQSQTTDQDQQQPDVPSSQLPPLTKADLLTSSFYNLPKAAQDEILRQGREQMKAAGFHITDQELIQHYNENQARALPLLTPQTLMAGGMVPTRYSSEKGMELVNPNLGGGANHQSDNQQYHYDALTGQNVENKNFWTDDVIQQNRNKFAQQEIAANQLNGARQVLKNNPGIVGPLSGSKAGNAWRNIAAAFGYSGPKTDEATLRQWLAGQMREIMGTVSNVKNQQEFENLQQAISDPTMTAKNWEDALNRAEAGLRSERSSLSENFRQHGLSPYAESRLPGVNITQPNVSAPGGGASTISTEAEFNALPRGAHFVWQYPDGSTKELVK